MNLSRRGFIKALLATSALAPIAPTLIEAVTAEDSWAKIMAARAFAARHAIRPVSGYYHVLMNPRAVEDIILFGQTFTDQAGNHVPLQDVFLNV